MMNAIIPFSDNKMKEKMLNIFSGVAVNTRCEIWTGLDGEF